MWFYCSSVIYKVLTFLDRDCFVQKGQFNNCFGLTRLLTCLRTTTLEIELREP